MASWRKHSQYIHSKHPPDEEYRDDGTRDVNDPVTSCFRLPKIEHAAIVAVSAQAAWYRHITVQQGVSAWLEESKTGGKKLKGP